MKTSFLWQTLILSGALLGMTGCSSDDEDTTSDASYIQFYNASPNSTAARLSMDEYEYTGVDFADSMARYSYTTGSVELAIIGNDEHGDDLTIYEQSLEMVDGEEHLFMLVGDYHSPEFWDISYQRGEMDELNSDEDEDYSKMQLLVAHAAMNSAGFDVYIGIEGREFIDATLLGEVNYKEYSDSVIFDTGDYTLYLTEPGSREPIYTTANMSLSTNTVYKLIIRESFGPGTPGITIDSVDSTSTPVNYANIDAHAEFRVFNGLSEQGSIDVEMTSHSSAIELAGIAVGQVSEFREIAFDDYGVSIEASDSAEVLANNLLVTFNQDESRSIFVYQDEEGGVKGMTFTQDLRPRAFEYQMNFANLVHEFEDLTVYFVRSSETIESAEYKLDDVDFAELNALTIPSGEYEISVVQQDDSDNLTLLYQSELLTLEGGGHYSMALIKDSTMSLGYKLSLFQ
ncbi:hypothetical protein [uncultured Shewanella sp.]|uniref:hypothetical protein n=1 Tax=Shewanella atlantica TaxID=271099 RepID=UPI002625DBB5|nr:hypothetical protein [uncultured Shewanella sp.]